MPAELEAKWAARDAKREAYEAQLEDQRMRSREHHIAIVQAAGVPRAHAEMAVDALRAAGVVFAYMGSWTDA